MFSVTCLLVVEFIVMIMIMFIVMMMSIMMMMMVMMMMMMLAMIRIMIMMMMLNISCVRTTWLSTRPHLRYVCTELPRPGFRLGWAGEQITTRVAEA